jgi:hypothetical protein
MVFQLSPSHAPPFHITLTRKPSLLLLRSLLLALDFEFSSDDFQSFREAGEFPLTFEQMQPGQLRTGVVSQVQANLMCEDAISICLLRWSVSNFLPYSSSRSKITESSFSLERCPLSLTFPNHSISS